MSSVVKGVKQPSRVEALDSARGWAILGVMAIHVSQAAPLPPGILHSLAVNGDMGVELFYVLSAFSLVMMLHAREMAWHHNLAGYFIRRFFRIVPMFWTSLLIATLMFFGKPSFWSPDGIGWTEVVLTAGFLHGIHPASINAVIPGGWSVAVEVMFYLVLPVLFRYTADTVSALKWWLISVGVYLLFGYFAQAYFDQTLPENARYLSGIYSWYMAFPAQLPVFMMGVVAFFVVKEARLKPVYAYLLACTGGLLLFAITIPVENHALPRHFLWALVFALFVVASVQRPLYLFDNPLMRLFGRVSYSVYLLHFFVLTIIGKLFRHSTIQAEVKFALLYFVVVGITYFMAAWSYRAIELRGMKIGAQLSRRFEIDTVDSKKELYGK